MFEFVCLLLLSFVLIAWASDYDGQYSNYMNELIPISGLLAR